MNTVNDTANDGTPRHTARSMPAWLDGRTVTLFATVVTATLALAAMMQTAHSRLASDIHQVRDELRADIAKLDDRLRAVEIDVAAVRTALVGFDARLRATEEHARHPVESAPTG